MKKYSNNTLSVSIKWASLFLVLILGISQTSISQTLVNGPMTGTPSAGDYYHPASIVLAPGFSFTASPGQSFHAYITGPGCLSLASSPSQDRNYVTTWTSQVAGITDPDDLPRKTTCEVMQSVQYFDGLGRPLQTVLVKANPDVAANLIKRWMNQD